MCLGGSTTRRGRVPAREPPHALPLSASATSRRISSASWWPPPDALRRGLLHMIQDVLAAAFNRDEDEGKGHVPSTRVLLTVAAAALSGVNATTTACTFPAARGRWNARLGAVEVGRHAAL